MYNLAISIRNYNEYNYCEIIDSIKKAGFKNVFIEWYNEKGHCNLFSKGEFNINVFKNKVFAVHLHDNFGKSDEHNLPFDGNINWDKTISQINDLNYKGYLVLECGYSEFYRNISIDDYYKMAYNRASKIKNLLNNCRKN